MRIVIWFLLIIAFLVLSGCDEAAGRISVAEQISSLRHEKAQLQQQLKQESARGNQLEKQIEILAQLQADERLENLYKVEKIKLTGFTNLYDKDKDGRYEQLIVYIQPIDEQVDVVKATGAVDVGLWDLSRDGGDALLGKWRVEPEQLKENWFTTLVTINYRLTFDVSQIIDEYEQPLTVKVTFTDYLSGKAFDEQRIIKPR